MRLAKWSAVALVLVLFLAFSGCDLLLQQGGQGTIELTIDGRSLRSRSIGPEISLEIASFSIRGESDAGKTFQRKTKESQIVIRGLDAGYWNVVVDAYSDEDVHLYTASQRVLVEGGVALPLLLKPQPVRGQGTITVDLSWLEGAIHAPVVDGQLVPVYGPSVPLEFTIAGDTATSGEALVDGGHYTLIVKLQDDVEGTQILVAGAIELVQIVADHTTAADFTFENVNRPGSLAIEIEVAPDFQDSLEVTISGGETVKEYGTAATLTGSVAGNPGNVVFTWYVNGNAVDTGVDELTIGGLIPGYYRVDLMAMTADGSHGGAATSWVQIAQPVP